MKIQDKMADSCKIFDYKLVFDEVNAEYFKVTTKAEDYDYE